MNDPLDFTQPPDILVVDDTPDNLTVLRSVLNPRYRVRVANSGARALEVARGAEPPDLILLDIMMPGMNGYAVCKELKADPTTRDIPVIFLTARSSVQDERVGLELGAVDYITKPVSPAIVLARVATHLSHDAVRAYLRDKEAWIEAEVERRLAARLFS